MKKPANKQSISRNELLKFINDLEIKICIEGFSTVLNWKESLGFGRSEDADSDLKTKR
jgi:hypothetical protein